MAITHIPAGRLADRLGRRPLIDHRLGIGFVLGADHGSCFVIASIPGWIVRLWPDCFCFVSFESYVTAARGNGRWAPYCRSQPQPLAWEWCLDRLQADDR